MAGLVEQRARLLDGHALGSRPDRQDLVAGLDLALLEDAQIKARPAVRHEKRCHPRLVHADADAVAGDARLRHLEDRAPDPVPIPDAHLAVGQALDREVLAELPVGEPAPPELFLPVAIGSDLIDENGPMLAAVACEVPLAVAVDVEPPGHAGARDGRLPDPGANRLSAPRDIARQTHVQRDKTRHAAFLLAFIELTLSPGQLYASGTKLLCLM